VRPIHCPGSLPFRHENSVLASMFVLMDVSVVFSFEVPVAVLAMMNFVVAFGAYAWRLIASVCRLRSHDDDAFLTRKWRRSRVRQSVTGARYSESRAQRTRYCNINKATFLLLEALRPDCELLICSNAFLKVVNDGCSLASA
jgi:hypothetical protein